MRRAWSIYAVCGAAVCAGYLLVPVGWPRDLVYDLLGLSSVGAIGVGVRWHRPARPAGWLLLAAGQLCSVAGDLIYNFRADIQHVTPFPSLADVFYLAAYLGYAGGMLVLVHSRIPGRDRAGLIDASIVTVGAGMLSWTFLVRPAVVASAQTLPARIVGISYPIADVLLLALLARLLTGPGARAASYRLLVAAVTLLLLADTVFAVSNMLWSYSGGAADLLFLASYVVWGAAGLHPSMTSLSDPGGPPLPFTSRRLLVLTAATLMAPTALAVQLALHLPIDGWSIVTGSVLLFLLVVARMAGLLHRVQHQADQLAELARTDALTGLANRRAGDAALVAELARAARDRSPLVVALLDLDHFKVYNDTHGHQAGDALLREAAAAWRTVLREQDLLYRYGGEEFAVLMPCSTAEAFGVVRRLQARTPHGQTISAGLAEHDGASSGEQLLSRADAALYHAKRTGRNKIVDSAASNGHGAAPKARAPVDGSVDAESRRAAPARPPASAAPFVPR